MRSLHRVSFGLSLLGSLCALAAVSGAGPGGVGSLQAQTETRVVVPGERYDAGPRRSSLLGSDYRDLWTTPVAVEVLDLRRFAGGLTPLRLGGGRQTVSLRLQGADGREYAFRSVDKWPALAQHEDLRGRLLGDLIQDQVSSLVPAAPLVAGPLARSAGVLHAPARLYVMPDDPALGEFRAQFAGMLGTLEERADEIGEGIAGFGGFELIAGTETFLEHIQQDPRHRLESRAYLAARLLDLLLGDWDRHPDQWRWGREPYGPGYRWLPIPRDRDYVMADYDGVVMRLVRMAVPNAVRFGEEYLDLGGLLLNARDLDRRLLADLDRPVWDSVALALRNEITDREISEAVAALPAEFVALRGAELESALRARRDRLPEVAGEFYTEVALVPHIHATDGHEVAEIQRYSDGSVEVRIDSRIEDWHGPFFQRVFRPDETSEIRLFLHGGDDRAVVHGLASRGIQVRIVGGGGVDVLVDSSRVEPGGSWTSLHDTDRGDVLVGHGSTGFDRWEYRPPEANPRGLIRIPPDDFGTSASVRPVLDYSGTRGIIVGIGYSATERAFRRHPYRSRFTADIRYAPQWSAFAVRTAGEYRAANPLARSTFELRASGLDVFRFYGFGNETSDDLPSRSYRVRRDLLSFAGTHFRGVGGGVEFGLGGLARYTAYDAPVGSPFRALSGALQEDVRALGGRFLVQRVETRVEPGGWRYEGELVTSMFPLTDGSADTYGDVRGIGELEIPIAPRGTRGRLQAGGQYVWGDYPVEAAAFLGGRPTLRGYPEGRFAGDAMAHGTVEAITRLGRLPLFANWLVEGSAFVDAGRVFLSGEDSSRWHATPGVGLTFSVLELSLGVTYAHGPKPRFYLDADFR